MSGILYYLPGQPSIVRAELEPLGLGHLLEPGGPGPSVTQALGHGPDGGDGCYFSVPGRGGRGEAPARDAEKARWSPVEGSRAWIGVLEGARPGPEDLAREGQLAGHLVELADGQRWLVPVARLLNGSTRFPRKLTREGGAWVQSVVRQPFADLFNTALRVWDTLTNTGSANLSLDEASSVAVSALGINYRLAAPEAVALELLDTDVLVKVLRALVDWPSLEELGKAEAAGPS